MNTKYSVTGAVDAFNDIIAFIQNNGFNAVVITTNRLGMCTFNGGYVFICVDDDYYIHITSSMSYNSSIPIYQNEKMPRQDGNTNNVYWMTMGIAGDTLYCNYNDNTFMFSCVDTSDVIRNTSSAGFGILTKLFNTWSGGTFVFGTAASVGVSGLTFASVGSNYLFAMLKLEDDAAFTNPRNNSYWATNIVKGSAHEATLALTLAKEDADVQVPTYSPFFLEGDGGMLYRGQANQMNCITLCMPIVFYVIRDPIVLKNYSCAGLTNILNSCSMYNMSSGRMIQSSYPTQTDDFQCFTITCRRASSQIAGYAGIAFRQEGN